LRDKPELHFDWVLMDCQMPVMDGYQATEGVRSGAGGKGNEAIPIIAMTANVMKGDKERCLEVGMDDYISKPIDFDELEAVLSKWLN
jgi:CheY-like chemotaxis protein